LAMRENSQSPATGSLTSGQADTHALYLPLRADVCQLLSSCSPTNNF
jgi:hypothetical protein